MTRSRGFLAVLTVAMLGLAGGSMVVRGDVGIGLALLGFGTLRGALALRDFWREPEE